MSQQPTISQPPPHSHFSQFSLPHSPNPLIQSHPHVHLQMISNPQVHPITFQAPIASIPTHQRPPTQVIGSPYLDQSPQFLAAIPVQPVFSTAGTVISPIQPAPDYIPSNVMSPAQNQIQDHMQRTRRHEELQKLIVQQQDELRRLSEQLFIDRYGIIPSIVNVPLPYTAPLDQADGGESSRSTMTNSAFIEQHPHMITHTQVSNQPHANPQIIVHQPGPNQPTTHQQNPPHSFELKHTSSDHAMEDEQQNEDIMQYMQHQSQTAHPQANQSMHQQDISNDDFELMPFQMLNQQAQILFSSGNASDCANNPSSNK